MTDLEREQFRLQDIAHMLQHGTLPELVCFLLKLARRCHEAEGQIDTILNDRALDSERDAALIAVTTKRVAGECIHIANQILRIRTNNYLELEAAICARFDLHGLT